MFDQRANMTLGNLLLAASSPAAQQFRSGRGLHAYDLGLGNLAGDRRCDDDATGSWDVRDNMGVIYWTYPNLILANSSVGVEVIDILPAGSPTRCTVRHSWLARVPAPDDDTRAGYDMIFTAVRDEDFVMLPQCAEGVSHGQHDQMIIGRNEIGVQHVIRVFAEELGVALD